MRCCHMLKCKQGRNQGFGNTEVMFICSEAAYVQELEAKPKAKVCLGKYSIAAYVRMKGV